MVARGWGEVAGVASRGESKRNDLSGGGEACRRPSSEILRCGSGWQVGVIQIDPSLRLRMTSWGQDFKYQRTKPGFRVTSRDENILLEKGLDNIIVIVYNYFIKDVPFITVVKTCW
jgi:hypothetical protein